jgi:hypothetical protein
MQAEWGRQLQVALHLEQYRLPFVSAGHVASSEARLVCQVRVSSCRASSFNPSGTNHA